MVEFVAVGAQAGLDIAQALAMGELRKGHTAILVLATETLDVDDCHGNVECSDAGYGGEDAPLPERRSVCRDTCVWSPIVMFDGRGLK